MLPDIPNQFPILQQWIGIGSLLVVVFGIGVSWRKMMRRGQRGDDGMDPVANMPKYYFEGPLVKVFDLLDEINGRLKEIQRSMKDGETPDRPARRR